MKKIILFLAMILLCSQAAFALTTAEQDYLDATVALSSGNIEVAKQELTSAVSGLKGNLKIIAEDVLNFLKKMKTFPTEALLISDKEWRFIGEVKEGETIQHLYFDSHSNNILNIIIKGDVSAELAEELGMSHQAYVAGNIGGYISNETNIDENTAKRIRIWYCTAADKTHVTYETYAKKDASKLDSLFQNIKCEAGFNLIIVGIVALVAICGVVCFFFLKLKKK